MTTTSGELLTSDEAAAMLGVSRHAIAGWVRQGKLPCVKIGQRPRWGR